MSIFIIGQDNDIYYAGANSSGQGGLGITNNYTTPYQKIKNTSIEGDLLDGTTIKKIIPFANNSACLTKDGKLYICGSSNYITNASSLGFKRFLINDDENIKIKEICESYLSLIVLTENGEVYSAGYNNSFTLGNGSTTASYVRKLTKIELDSEGKPLPPIREITTDRSKIVCLISENNELFIHGTGYYNVFLNGIGGYNKACYYSPTKILEDIKELQISEYLALATKTDGKVIIWGKLNYAGVKVSTDEYGEGLSLSVDKPLVLEELPVEKFKVKYLDGTIKPFRPKEVLQYAIYNDYIGIKYIDENDKLLFARTSTSLYYNKANPTGSTQLFEQDSPHTQLYGIEDLIISSVMGTLSSITVALSKNGDLKLSSNYGIHLGEEDATSTSKATIKDFITPLGLPDDYKIKYTSAAPNHYLGEEEEEDTTPALPNINIDINNRINIKTTDKFKTLITSSMLDDSYSNNLEDGYKINVGDRFERVFYKDELENIGFTLNTQSEKIKIKTNSGYRELATTDML